MVKIHRLTIITGGERYADIFHYLYSREAETHKKGVDENSRPDQDDRAVLDIVANSSIGDQKVVIEGEKIGYQFASTRYGKRTVTRTVYNLAGNENDGFTGEVGFYGRKIAVEKREWWQDWKVRDDV